MKVLFICTGNICRSPMAEGLLRHALGGADDVKIFSAGVNAIDGQAPSPNAIEALLRVGIDISKQRSRMLTSDLIDGSDYLFGMTQAHVEAVKERFPEVSEKTFLLRDFEKDLAPIEREIADPIACSIEVYEQCRDEIIQGISQIIKAFRLHHQIHQTHPIHKIHHNDPIHQNDQNDQIEQITSSMKIAFGADHAGFHLKEALKKHLAERGTELVDCGTNSAVSADYPDFAKAVASKINGDCDFGILICSTGIGMSIAANKSPGIYAALANDVKSARLSREHNDANVLCLSASSTDFERAKELVETFLKTPFSGGRHKRRLMKIMKFMKITEGESHFSDHFEGFETLESVDHEIAEVVKNEHDRQQSHLELIASENFTSRAVMIAQGSILTNKYAEGYPKKRWYGGCECVDEAEYLAIKRAKELFKAEHANVQPHSGSAANMAVYFSMLKPGDTILTMDLSHGGHLSHGNKANFSGRFFEVIHYGVDEKSERIDYEKLESLANEHHPKMITVGASAYPRIIDFEKMGQIAKKAGAFLLADIAHLAGLIVSGHHPSPIGHADFITSTTHKTLRGPRGGLILCGKEFAKVIDSQVFPGIQGGPLMHVIAAKAVCFKEALSPKFVKYQTQVIRNAAALARGLEGNGYRLVSGGTDNHLVLIDVGGRGQTGKECQIALDEAGITVNKNTIPFETRSPFQASGIRLGTPAVTSRGMKEAEMQYIAGLISEVLSDVKNIDSARKVRERVRKLTARYPLP